MYNTIELQVREANAAVIKSRILTDQLYDFQAVTDLLSLNPNEEHGDNGKKVLLN